MRAKILLADSAEVREGLLFLLGGAWTLVGPLPQPFAITGLIEVEWGECNQGHNVEFLIEDIDGNPLMAPGGMAGEPQPFRLGTRFEVGRPALSPQGTTFHLPIAINIPPIPWTPGRHYILIVRINTVERDRIRFSVRPQAAASQQPPPPPPEP
jgi:hypothetical protein